MSSSTRSDGGEGSPRNLRAVPTRRRHEFAKLATRRGPAGRFWHARTRSRRHDACSMSGMTRSVVATILLVGITSSLDASAHCDTTQGPVVTAARSALSAGDVNLVLHWVRPEDEDTVRTAFRQTLAVRALGPDALALADRHFFETLVRIHRAGEGAPFVGLTDAPTEPIIAAVDRALERGSSDEVEQQLVAAVRHGLSERFAAAHPKKGFRAGDVAEGRAFVAAYVPLTHWVEGVFTIAGGTVEHPGKASVHGTRAHPERSDGTTRKDEPRHTAVIEPDTLHRAPALPWLLAAVFAVAAAVEAVLLMHRRHRAAT